MKLYEIASEYMDMMELLVDCEESDETLVLDTLEGIEGEFNYKVENLCKILKELEAEAEKFKAEANRLATRAKTLNNRVDSIKSYIFNSMNAIGVKDASGELFSVKIQKNGGKAPLVIDNDVPVEYCKHEPDNDVIRKAIEAGEDIPFAHLGERGESLRIR